VEEKNHAGQRVNPIVAMSIALASLLGTAWHAIAQDANASYPSIAPVDQYLMEGRSSEIALARSAAPESISRDAEGLVLGRHGYETAIKGTNGFVWWNVPGLLPSMAGLLESKAAGSDLL